MLCNVATIVLALICATSALPNAPTQKLCPQSISTNYSDLTTLPPGTPGPLNPVQNPYLGLDYSSAWRAVQVGSVVKPGAKSVFYDLQTSVLSGPPTISVDVTTCPASLYRLKSFAWFVNIDLAQPDVTTTIDATVKLTGTNVLGKTVTASCSYKGGQIAIPIINVATTSQTCTLPATFDLLTDVKYQITSAFPTTTTASLHLTKIDYILYKCCK